MTRYPQTTLGIGAGSLLLVWCWTITPLTADTGQRQPFAKFLRWPTAPRTVDADDADDADIRQLAKLSDEELVDFLRARAHTPVTRQQLRAMIERLGSPSFLEREKAMEQLHQLGPYAQQELERAAAHPDAEVRSRASKIHAELTRGAERRDAEMRTVVATIIRRQSPGAVPYLLRLLPRLEQRYMRVMTVKALTLTAQLDDADVLRQGLSDPNASIRDAAATAYEVVLGAKVVPEIRPLLNDPDEQVQLRAAVLLLNHDERKALTTLGRLLHSPNVEIRGNSYRVLRVATGQEIDFIPYAPPAARAASAKVWQDWLREHGGSARLRLPVALENRRGLILVTNLHKHYILELNEQGNVVWQRNFQGAWCCEGLPNGHRLLGSNDGLVVEWDEMGKEVWRLPKLRGSVRSVRRLRNGNTLVAYRVQKKSVVQEFTPIGTVVWETEHSDYVEHVQRLVNGNTLLALYFSGSVIEIDQQGKIVWDVKEMGRPHSVQRLDNGNTLVCQESYGSQVVEVDPRGKVVWSYQSDWPMHAQRLADGTMIITERRCRVLAVDAEGKTMWEHDGGFNAGFIHLSAY
ncbi:MAG: HEAT repeat domain-containing protein [Gemmataceae bacterium]